MSFAGVPQSPGSPAAQVRPHPRRWPSIATALARCAVLALGAVSGLTAGAQTVVATVTAAPLPVAAAVNSVTNKIYVTSYIAKGQVTVIDGVTNATTAVPVGSFPYGIDVNMVTNKIYVANGASNTVTVIDGATNATTTIPVGINPKSVSVNPKTNKIYVVNNNLDGTISEIDGNTNTVTQNIFAGFNPSGVLVDADKNYIFAIAASNNLYTVGTPTVYLIEPVNAVIHEAELGKFPNQMAVDPVTNQLWVANQGGGDLVSIDSAFKNEGGDDALSGGGTSVAVNTVTHKAYFSDGTEVAVIDGKTAEESVIPVGLPILGPIAVDEATNTVFVASVTATGTVVAIDAATGLLTNIPVGAFPSVLALNPVTHRVYALNNDAAGTVTIIDGIPVAAIPSITREPQPQTVNAGSTVVFSAAATGVPAPTYQWEHNGTALSDGNGVSGASGPTLVISGVTPANAGAYACVATNSSGSTTSTPASLTVVSTTDPGRITNLSTRAFLNTTPDAVGNGVLIAGFVIGGTGSKTLVIRGVGPSLANFGVSEAIQKPTLALYDAATPANRITANTGWQKAPTLPTTAPWLGALTPVDATAADFSLLGAFALPQGSADSAVKVSLPAGAYTAQVEPTDAETGVVLAELYDDDPGIPSTRLLNISSRALTAVGANVMIAGFTIAGSTGQTLLIRASGPALTPLGVTATISNPQVHLYDSKGSLIASNLKWAGDPQVMAAAARVGAFVWPDPNSGDSAILITLPPGGYTAEADSAGSAGVALIEVYAVP